MPSNTTRNRTIALVACSKTKTDSPAFARDLYVSPLFRLSRRYAELNSDCWFVLSAKHGLVAPYSIIEPYDLTLPSMNRPERASWAREVLRSFSKWVPEPARILILAGDMYCRDLTGPLQSLGHEIVLPLAGLGLGKRIQYLKKQIPS